MFMDDEEIVEEQDEDVRTLIDQIRRCGTLYYERELPSRRSPEAAHLPEEVIEPLEKPMTLKKIFSLLQKCDQVPALQHCPICGKDVGIVLSSKPTPLRIPLDHPCDHCREIMWHGIIMIEVDDQSHQPVEGWCVANEACILHMFKNAPDMMNTILKERGVFIPAETWSRLGLPRYKHERLPGKFQPLWGERHEDLHQAALHL